MPRNGQNRLLGVARRAPAMIFRRTVLRFHVLAGAPLDARARVPVEVRRFDRGSPALYPLLAEIKGARADWEARFKHEHWCYVGHVHGRPACYVWASPREWRVLDRDDPQPLAPDVVFIYDVLTAAQERGQGVLPATLAWSLRELRAQGFERSCTIIDDRNIAAQRCFAHVGFRPVQPAVATYRICKLYVRRSILGSPRDLAPTPAPQRNGQSNGNGGRRP